MKLVSVFDNRGELSKEKIYNLLLLCCSWKEQTHNLNKFPLYIHVVRRDHTPLLDFVSSLGVQIIDEAKPHFLHNYSPTYNKLLGILGKKKNEPLLLLDNDIVFNRDIEPLKSMASRFVMANVADRQRASNETVEEIRDVLNLSLIDEHWGPWEYRYLDRQDDKPVRSVRGLYFNSGVVSLPVNSRLQWIWQRHSNLISKHFSSEYEKHKQRGGFGSDQMSLSTAICEHGEFSELPEKYNFRIFNFLNGDAVSDEDIGIIHHAGIRKAHALLEGNSAWSSGAITDAFYRDIIEDRINRDVLDDKQRRISIVSAVRSRLGALIDKYQIDNLKRFVG